MVANNFVSDCLHIVLDSNCCVAYCNESVFRNYPWERSAVLGLGFSEVRTQYGLGDLEISATALKTGEVFHAVEVLPSSAPEPDRTIFWSVVPELDEEGRLHKVTMTGICTRAISLHEDTKIYLNTLVNNIPHYVLWKNADSVFIGCNESFANSVGLSVSEVIGRTDHDFPWSQEESDAHVSDDKLVLTFKKPILNYEETHTLADGTKRTMLVSKVPLRDGTDGIIGIMAVFTDITHIKEKERQLIEAKEAAEAADRAKTDFIAMVSHEIRNPLNSLISIVNDFHLSGNLTEKQLGLLHTAKSSSDLVLGMVNDILDMTKFIRQGITMIPETFDIRELESVVEVLKASSKKKHLQYLFHCDEGVYPWVTADGKRLVQLLTNLAGNALKFTDKGHIKISVELVEKTERAQTLKFSVEDTGIGIPKEKQETIFGKFEQLDENRENKTRLGLGLGLAICQLIADGMDTKIQVDSTVGQGSTFSLIANFERVDDAIVQKLEQMREGYEDCEDFSHLRVLVVEDEPVNQKIIAHLLRPHRCSVDVVGNGTDAIAKNVTGGYDLILVDMGLPDMTGKKAISELLVEHRGRLVVLSGNVMPDQRMEYIELGVNDIMAKPVDKIELIKVLKDCNDKNFGRGLRS